MQEQLLTSGDYVILSYENPLKNVKTFTGITESIVNEGTGTILKKDFRYSFDSETFSEYLELNVANLNSIGTEPEQELWFQFRIALMSGGPVNVSSIQLTFDAFPVETILDTNPLNVQSDNYALPMSYKPGAKWEPYKINKAVRLYKDLNLMVNSLFGHEVHYYRAMPQGRSKDVFLMEYSLYEHEDKQCIKVIVPDNQFPDNKLNMGPFGVDFEMPFEVQIDKDYFQAIYGDGAGPQKRDVLFFPRTGRIYEISSSYLFRDFMNEPLYFKLTLIKWQPKSNAEPSVDLSALESLTLSAEKLFGKEMKEEQIDIANPVQFNPITEISDPVREYLAPLAEILDVPVMNYFLTVAEHQYNLSKAVTENTASVNLNSTELRRISLNATYYLRSANPIDSYPDPNESQLSMKIVKYVGLTPDGNAVFEFTEGNSQYAHNYPMSEMFSETSIFSLYSTEYSVAEPGSPLFACKKHTTLSQQLDSVKYKASNIFTSSDDRAISAWFSLKKNERFSTNVASHSYDQFSAEMTVTYERKRNFFIGDFISIRRRSLGSTFNLVGKIKRVNNANSVTIEVKPEIAIYLDTVYGNAWKTYTDLTLQLTYPKVFIDSMKAGKGIKVELHGHRYFIVTANSKEYFFIMPNTQADLVEGKWYGICVSFSNLFSQLTLNVWEMQWNSTTGMPTTSDLRIVYGNTVKGFPKEDRTSDYNFFIIPSDMELTNIRVWSQKIETDKQPLVLNQNIVKDASLAIVIDNAVPVSRLPYISYTH